MTKPVVRQAWHGTTLSVSVRCPPPDPFGDCSADLTVRVPAAAGARATVGSGSAMVTGLAGPVHLTATAGTLALAYLSGPLWVTATSGSITAMTGLNVPRLTADVGSGSLLLSFDGAPRSLSLVVGSGTGQVTVPSGTRYRIDAGRGGGAVHVSAGLSSPGSAGLIVATAASGTLSIGYPGGLPG